MIIPDGQIGEVQLPADPFQGPGVIEDHMGLIVFIVPGWKKNSGCVDLRHAIQFASGFEKVTEAPELIAGMMEMLCHFAAGNVMVGIFQHGGVVVEERVPGVDLISLIAEQLGNYRASTRSKIQPVFMGLVVVEDLISNGRNKRLIPGVVHIVVVFLIAFLLFRGRNIIIGIQQDGLAVIALIIPPFPGNLKGPGLRSTEYTFDAVFNCFHSPCCRAQFKQIPDEDKAMVPGVSTILILKPPRSGKAWEAVQLLRL